MVKEVERVGIPVVLMANLVCVAINIGANRIVPTLSIPHPLGDPNTSEKEQWKVRHHRVGVALQGLITDIQQQTVFEV